MIAFAPEASGLAVRGAYGGAGGDETPAGFVRTGGGLLVPAGADPAGGGAGGGAGGAQMSAGYRAARPDVTRRRELLRYGDADADLTIDLRTLRALSQALMRNNPAYRRQVVAEVNLAAHRPFRPIPMPDWEAVEEELGLEPGAVTDDEKQRYARQAERAYRRWGRAPEAGGEHDLESFTRLLIRSGLVDGDCAIIAQYDDRDAQPRAPRGRAMAFRWLAVEGAQIADQARGSQVLEGNTFAGGVERDAAGRPVALHVHNTHPGARAHGGGAGGAGRRAGMIDPGKGATETVRVPWRDREGRRIVCMVFEAERIGASRGAPPNAAGMLRCLDDDQVSEAALAQAKVSALFAGAITRTAPNQARIGRAEGGDAASADDPRAFRGRSMRPGWLEYLEPGEGVTFNNAPQVGNRLSELHEAIAVEVAGARGLAFEAVTKDFRRTTYSSARAALELTWQAVLIAQHTLIRAVLDPSYERVLEEALLRGTLTLPGAVADAVEELGTEDPLGGCFDHLCRRQWIRPPMPRIDAEKEIKGMLLAVANRMRTKTEVAAYFGNDFFEVLDELAREMAAEAQKLGGVMTADLTPGQSGDHAPQGEGDGTDETDDDDDGDPDAGEREQIRRRERGRGAREVIDA